MNLPLAFRSYLDVPLKHHPWCCPVAVASTSSSLSIICIGTTKVSLARTLIALCYSVIRLKYDSYPTEPKHPTDSMAFKSIHTECDFV